MRSTQEQINASIAFSALTAHDGSITIEPAHYSKNMMLVRASANGIFMSRAGRIASTLSRRRYSGRERGYIMSLSKAAKLQQYFIDGWDACSFTDTLEPPAKDPAP